MAWLEEYLEHDKAHDQAEDHRPGLQSESGCHRTIWTELTATSVANPHH